MKPLSEQIREAIENDGRSRYAIAKAAGLALSQLQRFMAGRPATTETLDRLGEALGLRITGEGRRSGRKGGSQQRRTSGQQKERS